MMEFDRTIQGDLSPHLSSRFPFKVDWSPAGGRCLRTTRDILPEETVLTDTCVLLGPGSPSVCIVCCSGGEGRCSGCSHSLCELCAQDGGHSLKECKLLQIVGYDQDMYNVILPIRFALMKERDDEMFSWLLMYMDHDEERRQRTDGMGDSVDRMAAIVAGCVKGITKQVAVKLIGILFTNCFELKAFQKEARALYPLVSLINHSCIPNLRHTNLIAEVNDGSQEGGVVVMKLESQRTIPSGTELTIRYNNYMQGYLQRQSFLQDEFYFTCNCVRCRDPTEFGTFASSLRCPHCRQGFALSSQAPRWPCNNCQGSISKEEVSATEHKAMDMIRVHDNSADSRNIKVVLTHLNSIKELLHPNHFIVMALKQKFLFSFGMNMKKCRSLAASQCQVLYPLLAAQESYCRQLLTYHEILDPGKSQLKTKILFELKKILLIQSKFLSESFKSEDKDQLVEKLYEIRALSSMVAISSIIPL